MQRHQYRVDFPAYMAECEANYLRIRKLLPEGQNEVVYHLQLADDQQALFHLRVTERCKYTTSLLVEIGWPDNRLLNSCFDLRVYHDAGMVEVIGYQNLRGIRPVYRYPNEKMFQRDEKFQQHTFLSECLAICLGRGSCLFSHQFA